MKEGYKECSNEKWRNLRIVQLLFMIIAAFSIVLTINSFFVDFLDFMSIILGTIIMYVLLLVFYIFLNGITENKYDKKLREVSK